MDPMYDLSVIIPVAADEGQIGTMINTVGEMFRNNQIRGQILVTSIPSLVATNAQVKGRIASWPCLDLIMHTYDVFPPVIDGFHRADAGIVLMICAPSIPRVSAIPEMFRMIRDGYDLVIGSRYRTIAGNEERSLPDRIITSGMTLPGRLFFPQVSDPLSDFFAFRKDVINHAPLSRQGGALLLEIMGKGKWEKMAEISISPSDRINGTGVCMRKSMGKVLLQVINIGWYSLFHHDSPAWKEQEKILRFVAVGLSGIIVNMAALSVLTSVFGIFYLISSLVAIELSILNNFFWNDWWTFYGEKGHRLSNQWHRLGIYHLISVGGLLINVGILFVLTEFFGVYYLVSNLIGIMVAFTWNFVINRNTTWKLD
jgi:dolichol-phosphate mannosyltransferase